MEDLVGIGVGVVVYEIGGNQDPRVSLQQTSNLGDQQLVYNGELEGTTQAIEYLSEISKSGQIYTVYSDNQAALYRLRTPSDNPGQACQIRAIEASKRAKRKGATITLEWVPGHEDI